MSHKPTFYFEHIILHNLYSRWSVVIEIIQAITAALKNRLRRLRDKKDIFDIYQSEVGRNFFGHKILKHHVLQTREDHSLTPTTRADTAMFAYYNALQGPIYELAPASRGNTVKRLSKNRNLTFLRALAVSRQVSE